MALASPNIPPPPQSTPLLLTGATLHTVSGASIANGEMLIDKGRIVALGAPGSAKAPANAQRIDLSGKHVYPGFIAANTAIGLAEVSAVRATLDQVETGPSNPNSRALVAVNADSEIIPVTRANGVLAALAVPRSGVGGGIGGTSALIQLDGWTWEDMGLVREAGLHVILPAMRFGTAMTPTLSAARIEEMQRTSAQRLRALDDTFDTARAYARAAEAGEIATPDARLEAMRPVFSGQRKVFVHADDLPQIRHALGFAERHGVNIVIVGGYDAPHVAPLLKARGIPVIVGGVHRLPLRRNESPDTPNTIAAKLHRAGVAFAIARNGAASDAARERSLPFEAAATVAYGLPREEALKSITLYPAQILGAADRLGSLEAGKLASFFVADGDPLEIRTNIERVFIQGREIVLEDKQTKLRDKYREKYRQLGITK
ncbi:MAG: amidohydrolase family protein [Betaproteobacteria bacterium]|nr:amidohydrolase family protein [Betaproteobacteria bacterium]